MQPLKELEPVSVTESGMAMLSRETQSAKQLPGISAMPSPRVTARSAEQPLNMEEPSVEFAGTATDSSASLPKKVWLPKSTPVQPLKSTETSCLQLEKALLPVFVREEESSIDFTAVFMRTELPTSV